VILPLLLSVTYVVSQVDDFQHHWLTVLLLWAVSLCTTESSNTNTSNGSGAKRGPQEKTGGGGQSSTEAQEEEELDFRQSDRQLQLDQRNGPLLVPSFALQLIRLMVSVLYFWTAIAKLDRLWIDGSVLAHSVSPLAHHVVRSSLQLVRQAMIQAPTKFLSPQWHWAAPILSTAQSLPALRQLLSDAPTEQEVFAFIARATIVVELLLLLGLHTRRGWLRTATFICGVSLHMTMHHSGLRIGLFSYVMSTLYFLVPPPLLERLLIVPLVGASRRLYRFADSYTEQLWSATAISLAFAIGASFAPLLFVRFEYAILRDVSLASLALVLVPPMLRTIGRRSRRSHSVDLTLHAFVCLAIVLLHLGTAQRYRFYETHMSQAVGAERFDDAELFARNMTLVAPREAAGWTTLAFLLRQRNNYNESHEIDRFVLGQLNPQNLHALVGQLHYFSTAPNINRDAACVWQRRVRRQSETQQRWICSDEECEMNVRFCQYADAVVRQAQKRMQCPQ
jgi:hypothetical protein